MTSMKIRRFLWMVPAAMLALAPGTGLSAQGGRRPRLSGADEIQSPFLLKSTGVKVIITGPVAHAVVTQSWENPNSFPVDGLYIFPLPENAAVTDMSLKIGDRLIRGEMKRREEARAIYEQARSEGRVAGLLDQERPNVFAQQVANILPGAGIQVILAYDHEIRCDDGAYCQFVFPTVVGPRFIPGRQIDPGRIDPPVVFPHQSTGQRLRLQVYLDAGVSLREVESPSHRVRVSREGDARARVTLAGDEEGILDRDFRLRWRVGGGVPEIGLLAWRDPSAEGEKGVFTLLLQPPSDPRDEEAEPRELVFVLDCSGSMMGVPLEAAKNVVRKALTQMRPGDTFQIIRFSDSASGMGERPIPATPSNLRRALAYLDSLQGEGGTEMISGIRAALGREADPERLRIVAFLTDGYIGNEREILGEVRRRLGGARLFSFGIGSSVNRYLLEGLAEEGRGEADFLAPRESPDEMVDRFVQRIATPVLTDIHLTWEDLEVEDQEPLQVPDLFAGSPLVVRGRYRNPGTGLLILEGTSRGRPRILRRVVSLPAEAADHEALGRLWARARIHRLERELHDGAVPEAVESITRLGLRHHLMTSYTSLVAVDSEVSDMTGSSTPMTVAVEMPRDVSYEGNFGVADRARQVPLQAPPSTASTLRSLGYLGRESAGSGGKTALGTGEPSSGRAGESRSDGGAMASEAPLPSKKAEGKDAGKWKESAASFKRVSLFLPDGSAVAVESDGEVWRIQGRERTLLSGLTTAEMTEFGRLLASARPESWSGGGSSGRILFEGRGVSRVASLPSADPSIQALADWIRRQAGE
jgi:Ca-activated chloride channel homolog